MSKQIIKYTINEILSLFIQSDPPEFLCDVSKIFVEESRTPIGKYPKNVSKITVSPKNTNLKTVKSEPIRNDQQNFQNKVSEFSPKLIKQQNDDKTQSTEFIPSFNPISVGINGKSKSIADSESFQQTIDENSNIDANSCVNENSQLPIENQIQNAPIFVPQDTPFFTPQDLPIFIPQNPVVFPSENSQAFFTQYPPGFYPQDYPFFDNSPPRPFSPQLDHLNQTENQNYDGIFHAPMPFPEQQPQNQLFSPIQPSTDSNYSIIDKEQADEFKSVIDSTPDKFNNDSYTNQQNEYIQPSPILSPHIPPQDLQQQQHSQQIQQQYHQQQQYQLLQNQYQQQLTQYQPQLQQFQSQQQYQLSSPQLQYQQQLPQHQVQQQQFQDQSLIQQNQQEYQKQLPQPQQFQQQLQQNQQQSQQQLQQNQQFNQSNHNSQLNKDSQQLYNQNKNEKKPKNTFSADTVVEDAKNIKITPWGQVKPKVSQPSFQEIEESAKAIESSNPGSSMPMSISFSSSKPTKPSTPKITITTSPITKNENGKNKKGNRNPHPLRPTEIPKPANFTADNIAISQVGETAPPPKPFVVYNKNFSSVTPIQIQNVSRNTPSFTITTQNNPSSKPAGFNPGNIAIPPNFANNYPP